MDSILIFIFVVLFSGCDSFNKESKTGSMQSYDLVELYHSNDNDCSIYTMNFNGSGTIIRYALSGPCRNLSIDTYLKEFNLFYSKYTSEYGCRKGLIQIEFYEHIGDNFEVVAALRGIIKKVVTSECEVKVVRFGKQAVVFEVIDN